MMRLVLVPEDHSFDEQTSPGELENTWGLTLGKSSALRNRWCRRLYFTDLTPRTIELKGERAYRSSREELAKQRGLNQNLS
jgi:hypothetical protein